MFSINNEVNVRLITRFLKKYLVALVFVSLILGSGASLLYDKLVPTEYEASSLLVQNDDNYVLVQSFSQITGSSQFKKLVNQEIAKSKWKNYAGKNDYTASLTPKSSTSPFFTISVTSLSKSYTEYLTRIISRLFDKNVKSFLKSGNVSVASRTIRASEIDKTASLVKIGLGVFVLVGLVGTLVCFIRMIIGGKINDDKYIRDVFEVTYLGTLSEQKK